MDRQDFEDLRSRHQQVLLDFLNRELDLGFAFASRGSRDTALRAVLAVERLVDQVEDRVDRRKIDERLVDLNEAIHKL